MKTIIPIVLGIVAVLVISGCISQTEMPNLDNITNNSTAEEICLAIQPENLKNQCLAYVKEDASYCQDFGCYALAYKLKDKEICTMKGSDRTLYWVNLGPYSTVKNITNERCTKFAELNDTERVEIYKRFRLRLESCTIYILGQEIPITENGSECTDPNICFLDEEDCYGSCEVARADCIMKIATVTRNPELCELPQVSLRKEDCYEIVGSVKKDIEICKKAESKRGTWMGRCFFDIVSNNTRRIYDTMFWDEADKYV